MLEKSIPSNPKLFGLKKESMPLYDESSLFIGNLNYKCLEFEVEEYFGHIAPVKSVTLCKLESGAPKGVGYVTFYNKEDAVKALKALDRQDFQGRKLFLKLASDPITPKENKPAMNPANTNKRREISFLIDKFKEETDETIRRQIAFVVSRDLHLDEPDSRAYSKYSNDFQYNDSRKIDRRNAYDRSDYRNQATYRDGGYRDGGYRDRDYRRNINDFRNDHRNYNGYRDNYRTRETDIKDYRSRYDQPIMPERSYYSKPAQPPRYSSIPTTYTYEYRNDYQYGYR